jgi:hypothetical protein
MASTPWRRRAVLLVALAALGLPTAARSAAADVPSPEAHFGFRMGAEGRIATTEQIEAYFEAVASHSDRVKIVDIGPTTEGHRTIGAIVSSADNIRNLDRIRAANQRLSDPRTLSSDDARQLAAQHKAVLAIGASIHAAEVGATQAANELLYALASARDPATLAVLDNVIVILIPSLNPDGHRLVVDWYNKGKGTPLEGGLMPWLYHKYAGHDINRDAFMMNLAESRNLARFFYTVWHPQVFVTMHQMESNGPRFAAPPNVDPINPNYDPLVWREAALLGSAMTLQLERDGRSGVVSNAIYDYFWPGYEDSAPLGHNTVCLLTEVASVKVATSITVEPGDLRGNERGLPEYRRQINFPNPWPGGTWTLRDIVDYDLSAIRGLLFAVAAYREPIVQNFYDLGARAVEAGSRGGPFAFIIPSDQRDPSAARKLEELLLQGGVEIHRTLEPFRADGDPYPAGTDVVLLAQPYRAYVKTLLERQDYPVTPSHEGGPRERPYDATGWTLPAQLGVDVRTIARTFEPPAMARVSTVTIPPARVWTDRKPSYYVVDGGGNGGAIAANRLLAAGLSPAWLTSALEVRGFRYAPGSMVVAATSATTPVLEKIAAQLGLRADGLTGKPPAAVRPLVRARAGLYKPWVETVDEGWTRWVLEQYEFPYASVSDAEMRAGNLRSRFDVLILPSQQADRLAAGYPPGVAPVEYTGGLGDAGVRAIKAFVDAGGTLVSLDQASDFVIGAFGLPVRDVTRAAKDSAFFCPGSLLRLDVDPAQPLTYGMAEHATGFFGFSSAFEILPNANAVVAARYSSGDLLVSGWLEGEQLIAGRAAVVQLSVGAGHVVLLGFPVQHRGQSLATFRLLFNALLTGR